MPALLVVTSDRVIVDTGGGFGSHVVYGLRRDSGAQLWQTGKNHFTSLSLSPLHSENVVFFVPQRNTMAPYTQAVDAATGRDLWQRAQTDTCPVLIGVYGDVTAFADMRGSQVQLVNTRTGQNLEPARDEDKRLITASVWEYGAAQRVNLIGRPGLLDLSKNTLTLFPLAKIAPVWENTEIVPGTAQLVMPSARSEQIRPGAAAAYDEFIVRVDEDNGMAGHSVWPKYLVGLKPDGSRRWQFPDPASASDLYDSALRMQAAWAVPQAGMALAQNQHSTLFGVRMRDGKQAWQRAWHGSNRHESNARVGRGLLQSVAVYDRGAFTLSIPNAQLQREQNLRTAPFPVRRALDYVDAQTGTVYPVADLTLDTTPGRYVTISLSIEGDDLFVATPISTRAFRCRALLRQAAVQTPALRRILAELPPRYTLVMLDGLPPNAEAQQKGTQALAINNAGQIVGLSAERPVMWQHGRLLPLPMLPGDNTGMAYAINGRGDILARSEHKFTAQAVLLRQGAKTAYLPGLGGRRTQAVAVNNRRDIVGYATLPPDKSGQTLEHPVLWRDGRIIDLGLLPGYAAGRATALNDRGQVVGFCYNGDYSMDTVPPRDERAWLWDNGKMTALGTLPGYTSSRAEALNNRGQVAGAAGKNEAPVQRGRAWTWQNGQMTDLGALDVGVSNALFINDAGVIAGMALTHTRYDRGESDFWQPVRWQNNRIELLRVPNGIETGEVSGLDASGRLTVRAWGFSQATAATTLWTVEDGRYTRFTLPQNQTAIRSVSADGRLLLAGNAYLFDTQTGGRGNVYIFDRQTGRRRDLVSPARWDATNGWQPRAINNAGDVAGTVWPPLLPASRDFLLTREGKIVTFLTSNPKIKAALTGLNDAGQVVGQWTLAGNVASNDPFRRTFAPRPFRWRDGVTMWLNQGHDPVALLSALAVNNRGQILATMGSHNSYSGEMQGVGPVLWQNGYTRKLEGLTFDPLACNDAGLAVGAVSATAQNIDDHVVQCQIPAVWQAGRETRLTPGQAYDDYAARAVNRRGQVVGDSNRGAFMWQSGHFFPLNDLIPPQSGWHLSCATGINDRGQIVGYGLYYAGRDQERAITYHYTRAFLLTPVSP